IVTVRDDGVGIVPSATGKGGLGMRIVQQLAEQLGGTITITSEAGTTWPPVVRRAEKPRADGPRPAHENAAAAHSGGASAPCSTTLPQRTISDLTNSRNPTTDVFSKRSMPSFRISVSISGSVTLATISRCNFATMASGVWLGATIMCHPGNAPNVGRPASAI